MRQIPLTRGKEALVDDEDYELVSRYRWRVQESKAGIFYAVTGNSRNSPFWSMGRLIMGFPEGKLVDHKDGDGLNNQRKNLRVATCSENVFNRRTRSKSGYKGVSLCGKGNSWVVRLGGFTTPEEAARAYDIIAPLAHGKFAVRNFPEETCA